MALIDYEAYLDGDEWPSESAKAVVDERGFVSPDLKPVIDMPPQYAVNALRKLVRWAEETSFSEQETADRVRMVRSSNLGRLLARHALGIEDFELYAEHGIDREPLSNRFVAREICRQVLEIIDLDPVEAARLSTELAMGLSNDGITLYKESA